MINSVRTFGLGLLFLYFTELSLAQQLRHFSWYYMNTKDSADQNRRDWFEESGGGWREVYPNGIQGHFTLIAKGIPLTIFQNGQRVSVSGSVIEKDDKTLIAFVPDQLMTGQWLQWKAPGDFSGPWAYAGEITVASLTNSTDRTSASSAIPATTISSATQSAQNSGGIAPTSPTGLDTKEGPPVGGLQVGMTQAELLAAYGSKQPAGWTENDPTFGRHIVVRELPHEEGTYVTQKVSIYLTTPTTPPEGKIFMIDRTIGKDQEKLMEPDDAIDMYSTIVHSLSQSFPVLDSFQKDVAFPFTCENGGTAARTYIDWLNSQVNQGADINSILPANKRAVLAMHCGAVKTWYTKFKLNSRVVVFVSVDVSQGGGMHASVVESVYDGPASTAVSEAIRKIRNQ